ncbi:PIR protein [Plasmodium vivax]|uniref:VIR protein n=1 Tax=Plasmodium vivax TaxID=5855 RepID=A0A564ZUH9_PLAVI|nr:PIR protein [Plasmodium vivax]
MGRVTVVSYDVDTSLTKSSCVDKYIELLGDIEKKIEKLNIKEDTEISKECDELVRYINSKNVELTECYKQKLLDHSFNFKEGMKGFINNYDKYYQCLRKSASLFKESFELKNSCEEHQDCNKAVAPTEEGEAEMEIESPSPEDSSEAQGSPKLKQPKADEEKSKEQSAISEFPSRKLLSDKAEGPDTQISGQGTDQYSNVTSLTETPSQPVYEGDHSAPKESETQSSIRSAQIGSNGDVVSSLTTEASDSSKSFSSTISITDPPVAHEIEDNPEQLHSPPNEQSLGSKTDYGKVHTVEGSGDENSMGKVSEDLTQVQRVTENADTAVRDTIAAYGMVEETDNEEACPEVFNSGTDSQQARQIGHIGAQSLPNSASSDTGLSIQNLASVNSGDYSSQNTSYTPSGETANVDKNTHTRKTCNKEGQCQEKSLQKLEDPNQKEFSFHKQPTLCGKDKCPNNEEIQQGKAYFEKGDGSYELSEEMPYKNYIQIGIIILAIILLLALLLKFTPLGFIFSNKRKKIRKNMQEKVQRVLLQPPYNNERNISMAYGHLGRFV